MPRSLTILACPKAFTGHVGTIQRNAITSWTKLEPRPDIFLFGDESGTRAICDELGLRFISGVARNELGTPVLSALLAEGQRLSTAPLLCFINADIVLMDDFSRAIAAVAAKKQAFLMIGQRSDMEIDGPIAFDKPLWRADLRAAAAEHARLHGEDGIDYFVFTPHLFDPAPPLLIGRAAIDNWLVFRARRRWCAVVDATKAVLAIHQNHDYSHHADGRRGVYHGDEAEANRRLAGGPRHIFWINDRTHILLPEGLIFDRSLAQLRRHWDRLPVLLPPVLSQAVSLLHAVQRRIGAGLRAAGLRKSLIKRESI